jgi:hypothetical protein
MEISTRAIWLPTVLTKRTTPATCYASAGPWLERRCVMCREAVDKERKRTVKEETIMAQMITITAIRVFVW